MIKNFIKALLKDLIREILLEEINKQTYYTHQDPFYPLNGDYIINYDRAEFWGGTSPIEPGGTGGYPKSFFDIWKH